MLRFFKRKSTLKTRSYWSISKSDAPEIPRIQNCPYERDGPVRLVENMKAGIGWLNELREQLIVWVHCTVHCWSRLDFQVCVLGVSFLVNSRLQNMIFMNFELQNIVTCGVGIPSLPVIARSQSFSTKVWWETTKEFIIGTLPLSPAWFNNSFRENPALKKNTYTSFHRWPHAPLKTYFPLFEQFPSFKYGKPAKKGFPRFYRGGGRTYPPPPTGSINCLRLHMPAKKKSIGMESTEFKNISDFHKIRKLID